MQGKEEFVQSWDRESHTLLWAGVLEKRLGATSCLTRGAVFSTLCSKSGSLDSDVDSATSWLPDHSLMTPQCRCPAVTAGFHCLLTPGLGHLTGNSIKGYSQQNHSSPATPTFPTSSPSHLHYWPQCWSKITGLHLDSSLSRGVKRPSGLCLLTHPLSPPPPWSLDPKATASIWSSTFAPL